jgi:hypothetical protein
MIVGPGAAKSALFLQMPLLTHIILFYSVT